MHSFSQSILDRIPTAKVLDRIENKSIIEADVCGEEIKMFPLNQGSWFKVLAQMGLLMK